MAIHNILPKFTDSEFKNSYEFISDLEEVYVMMKIQQLSNDVIRLKFILFALKDNAKNWLYGMMFISVGKLEHPGIFIETGFLRKPIV